MEATNDKDGKAAGPDAPEEEVCKGMDYGCEDLSSS